MTGDVDLLFTDGWRVRAGLTEPLVPLRYRCMRGSVNLRLWTGKERVSIAHIRTTDLYVGILGAWVVLYDAPEPVSVQGVFEFPERVAC